MAADPSSDHEPTADRAADDELDDVVAPDLREEDFWSAADRLRPGLRAKLRGRRTKDDGRRVRAGSTLRSRAAAAWAAEMTAMRALRKRPAGAGAAPVAPRTTDRRRKTLLLAMGAVAVLALLVAVGDAALRDGPPRQEAAGAEGDGGSELVSTGPGSGTDQDAAGAGAVESEIIDLPDAKPPAKRPAAKPAAAPAQATTTTTAAPRPTDPSTPPPARPTPAPVTPPTPAPKPTVPPTAPPTTAPKPPAPRVDQFTATAASQAGGACPALQWATTFRWATTNATTVAITGLLEPAQNNLPADGSKVVCRVLPGGPLGGWTLTATGPGGSATATA